MKERVYDYTGQKFTRLLVIKRGEVPYRGASRRYLCICDCGKKKWTTSKSLISGDTKSCGCLRKERKTCGGRSNTKIYNKWFNMKDRVLNKKHRSYKNYGGRGISIYEPWLVFKNFENYVLKNLGVPLKGQELDRKNNDGNYEPGNIEWKTRKQNLNNMRKTTYVFYKKVKYAVSELYDLLKPVVIYSTFYSRVYRRGWDIDKAAITPSDGKFKRNKTFHFSPRRMAMRRKARGRLTQYSGRAIKVR